MHAPDIDLAGVAIHGSGTAIPARNGAARRYRRIHRHEPKNRFGTSLFAVHCRDGLAWARSAPSGELLAAFPRYHPRWAWRLVHVPILRELLVSNLVLALRKH